MAVLPSMTFTEHMSTTDMPNMNIENNGQLSNEYQVYESLVLNDSYTKNMNKVVTDSMEMKDFLLYDFGGEIFSNYTILDNAKNITEMLEYFDRPDAYYTKFEPFVPSSRKCDEVIVKAELHGFQHLVFPELTEFNMTEWVESKVETNLSDVSDQGSTITLNEPFYTPPNVTAVIMEPTDAARFDLTISNITEKQFFTKITNKSNSTSTSGKIKWVASGY